MNISLVQLLVSFHLLYSYSISAHPSRIGRPILKRHLLDLSHGHNGHQLVKRTEAKILVEGGNAIPESVGSTIKAEGEGGHVLKGTATSEAETVLAPGDNAVNNPTASVSDQEKVKVSKEKYNLYASKEKPNVKGSNEEPKPLNLEMTQGDHAVNNPLVNKATVSDQEKVKVSKEKYNAEASKEEPNVKVSNEEPKPLNLEMTQEDHVVNNPLVNEATVSDEEKVKVSKGKYDAEASKEDPNVKDPKPLNQGVESEGSSGPKDNHEAHPEEKNERSDTVETKPLDLQNEGQTAGEKTEPARPTSSEVVKKEAKNSQDTEPPSKETKGTTLRERWDMCLDKAKSIWTQFAGHLRKFWDYLLSLGSKKGKSPNPEK